MVVLQKDGQLKKRLKTSQIKTTNIVVDYKKTTFNFD